MIDERQYYIFFGGFMLPAIVCFAVGIRRGKWAEGLLLAAILGPLGLLIAAAFWAKSTKIGTRLVRPKNWSAWSGNEVTWGCAIMGIGVLALRAYPLSTFRFITQTQFLLASLSIIGLGAVFAVVGVWKSDSQRVPIGEFCANCDYNLAGNTSGVCPECGATVGETASTESDHPPNAPRR